MQETKESTKPNRDRYTIGMTCAFCLYFLLLVYNNELDCTFNLWMFLVLLLLFLTVIIGLWWLIALIVYIVQRRWRRVTSVLWAPFIAATLFTILGIVGLSSQYLRFEWNKRNYQQEISRLPVSDAPRFHAFNWGSTGGAAVANFFFTLVFDESDEIALPPEQQTKAWHDRVLASCGNPKKCTTFNPDSGHNSDITRMTEHFYLVTDMYE